MSAASLRDFLATLDPSPLPVDPGGSNAVIRRVVFQGTDCVVKYAEPLPDTVDGHDPATLTATIDQLDLIRRHCPAIAHRYAQPVACYRGADGAAIVMRHFPGVPLSTLDDPLSSIRLILSELIPFGYLARRVPAAPGTFAQLHLDRVERRTPLVDRHLPESVRQPLAVGDDRIPPLTELFREIRDRPGLLRALDPPWLFFPAHGDLSLANILVDPRGAQSGYALIDPRGTTQPWDATYDLAKMLWSLSGYDAAMRHGFVLTELRVRDGQTPALEAAADSFAAMLTEMDGFAELTERDPHWQTRLQISVAMHCLAEAACRLSDRKPRRFADAHGYAARLELAIGLHLMGRVLLHRMLSTTDFTRRVRWQPAADPVRRRPRRGLGASPRASAF